MAPNQPLHVQLYSKMAQCILSGAWPEGEKVPTEKSLVEEFGTSRGPVRQALSRLRAEGLIVGGRGAPPRVQNAIPAQSFDTYMSFTEWAEELGRVPGQKTIEVSRQLADEYLAGKLRVPKDAPIVKIVRQRSMDGEAMMFERSYYPLEVGKHLLDIDLDTESIYQTLMGKGINPARAQNVISSVLAEAPQAQWLGIEVGSPLLRVQRVSYDEAGEIIDFNDNLYLPDKATFAIENTRMSSSQLSRIPAKEGVGSA